MKTTTALLLASLGIDSFTLAQAAPAPNADQHVARPRYYFPRHVKRQIFPNITSPATPSNNGLGNLIGGIVDGVGNVVAPPPPSSAAPAPVVEPSAEPGPDPVAAPVAAPEVVSSVAPEPASSSDSPGLVGGIVDGVTDGVNGVVSNVASNVAAPLVTGVVDPVVGGVGDTVSDVAGGVGGVVSGAVSGVVAPIVTGAVPGVVSGVGGAVDGLASSGVAGLVGGVATGVVAPVVTGVVPGVVSGVGEGVVAPVVTGVVDPVVSNVAGPSGIVPEVVDGVAGPSGVVDGVVGPSGVVDGVAGPSGAVDGIVAPVVSGVAGPSGVLPGVATGIVAPVVSGVGEGVVAPIVTGVVDPVVSGVAGPSGVLPGVVDGVAGPTGVLPGVVTGVVDPVLSGVAGPTGVVPGIVDPVVSGIANPTGVLPSVVDPIVSGIANPTGVLPPVIIPPTESQPAVVEPAPVPLPSGPGSILVGLSTVLSGGAAPTPAPAPPAEPLFPSGAGITGPGTGGFVAPTPVSNSFDVFEPPSQTVAPQPPANSNPVVIPAPVPYTSLLAAPAPSGSATVTASGIPTSMPKVIAPPGGSIEKPENTTLIQIGFTHELNYAFVSTNPTSAQQIFKFLPEGIAYGLLLDNAKAKMYNIQPYDTSKAMGYLTTLALLYVPTDLVNQLAVDLHTPNSGIYNNPDGTTSTLMSFINPAIPLIAGQPMDGTYSGQDAAAETAVVPGSPQGAAPFGGDSGNSNTVKSSAIAIGASTTAGVVLFGAAMGLVAQRYRKKKHAHSRHSRNSSITGSEPAWMSGAGYARNSHGSGSSQGRSIRSQGISAPVMSENSLGWN